MPDDFIFRGSAGELDPELVRIIEGENQRQDETIILVASESASPAAVQELMGSSFANVYADAAEAIAARRSGSKANPLALHFPNSWDGLMGVRFVHSVIESSQADGKWVKC